MQTSSPAQLEEMLEAVGARRIAVDGINGAGKSYLARDLSARFGLPRLDLDSYLEADRGAFVPHIRKDRLRRDLDDMPEFVIAGVCMLQVLEILRLDVDVLVYIKRVKGTKWTDESSLVPSSPVDEHVSALRREHEVIAKAAAVQRSFALDEEVIRYHARYRPQQRAGICYARSAA